MDIVGKKVAGYPVDGGPDLLDVRKVTDTHFIPSITSKPINVQVGNEFTLALPNHFANSGYEWQLAQALNEQTVAFVRTEFKPAAERYNIPGLVLWHFKAVGRGETHIVLKEFRSWEHNVPPTQILTFTVIVN